MLQSSRAKTILSFVIVIGLFVLTVIGRIYFEQNKEQQSGAVPKEISYRTTTVMAGKTSLTTRIADTEFLRMRGLSGTPSLGESEAMLFVFDQPGRYPFWMKEMNYPIDIIWLDATKHIVFIKEHATPESFPEEFSNTEPAQYVLEVVDGFIKKNNLSIGDSIFMDIGIPASF